METISKTSEMRKFYQELWTVKKGYQPVAHELDNDEGNLISEPEEFKIEWHWYFEELLNCPHYEEIRKVIVRLKNNKCPGIDGIPGELWKYDEGGCHRDFTK